VWSNDNPLAIVENNFQILFIDNVWCEVLDDQLTGPFFFEGRPTEEA